MFNIPGTGDLYTEPTGESGSRGTCVLLKQQLEARQNALPHLQQHQRPELHP